jgi:hypothetical protein
MGNVLFRECGIRSRASEKETKELEEYIKSRLEFMPRYMGSDQDLDNQNDSLVQFDIAHNAINQQSDVQPSDRVIEQPRGTWLSGLSKFKEKSDVALVSHGINNDKYRSQVENAQNQSERVSNYDQSAKGYRSIPENGKQGTKSGFDRNFAANGYEQYQSGP